MGQLLETISSAELTEWLAYDQIEPFGPQREDLRTGLICSAVVNHSMSPPKSPVRASDCRAMPRLDQASEKRGSSSTAFS